MVLLILAVTVSVPGSPHRVAAGDFNGDRRVDLAVACEKSLAVLIQDPAGGFSETSRLALPRTPTELAVADFNRDGRLDIAAADHDTYAIETLMGDGKGAFTRGPLTRAKTTGKPHIHGLLQGDWNRDGRADLILVSVDEGHMIVLVGDGEGRFAPGRVIKSGSCENPAVGDLNGDGIDDLAVPAIHHRQLQVWIGDGKGDFTLAPEAMYRVPARPFFAAIGDLNGDGKPDIAVTHDDTSEISVLLNRGGGKFRLSDAPTRFRGRPYAVGIRENQVFAAMGDGVLSGAGRLLIAEPETYDMMMADLDGDKRPDLIGIHPKADKLTIMLTSAKAR